MEEPIGAFRSEHESCSDGFPKVAVHLFSRTLIDQLQQRHIRLVAYTGKLLQSFLSFDGQSIQLLDQEVDHIVGVAFGVNAIEVPTPSRIESVERKQSLFSEGGDELNGEERIASSFLMN